MEPARRIRVLVPVFLALLSWMPGIACAGCDACPLATVRPLAAHPGGVPRVAPPSCHQESSPPAIQSADCCDVRVAVPAGTSRAAVLSPSLVLAPAVAVELPAEPAGQLAARRLPSPPLLYEEIGLYTLHSTFLI